MSDEPTRAEVENLLHYYQNRAVDGEARLAAAEARIKELEEVKQKVRHAIGRANGRWCEWGERAEMVLAMLEEAIGDAPPPEAEKKGGE